jgi:hypothetical protein
VFIRPTYIFTVAGEDEKPWDPIGVEDVTEWEPVSLEHLSGAEEVFLQQVVGKTLTMEEKWELATIIATTPCCDRWMEPQHGNSSPTGRRCSSTSLRTTRRIPRGEGGQEVRCSSGQGALDRRPSALRCSPSLPGEYQEGGGQEARGLWTGDPTLCAALLHCQEKTWRAEDRR